MLLKKNKVEILRGEAFFSDEHTFRLMTENASQSYSFKNIILATGSRPTELKGFKFGKRIVDSTGALNFTELPKKLIVVGGGYIGSELASAYANLGSEVTIVQRSERILREFESDVVKLVTDNFAKRGVNIITNAGIIGATEDANGVVVTLNVDGKEQLLEADAVLVSTGRRPNTDSIGLESMGINIDDRGFILIDEQARTNVPHIYAIGDIVAGPALAHKASYEAKVAAEVIAGENVKIDYRTVPAVCFTDPEIAVAGLTVDEAKADGIDAKAAKFPFGANGRAMSLEERDGFVRIVFDKTTELILGAQIVGPGASDLIAEMTLAIEAGMTLEDVALTIHAHPTLAETIMDATEVGLGLPIHI